MTRTNSGNSNKQDTSASSDKLNHNETSPKPASSKEANDKENEEQQKSKEQDKPVHLRQGGKVVIGLPVSDDEGSEEEDEEEVDEDNGDNGVAANGLTRDISRLAIGTEINEQEQADANQQNGVYANDIPGEVADTESKTMAEGEEAVVAMQEKMAGEPEVRRTSNNIHKEKHVLIDENGGHVEHHEHAQPGSADSPVSPKSAPGITNKRLGKSVEKDGPRDPESSQENICEVYDESEFPDSLSSRMSVTPVIPRGQIPETLLEILQGTHRSRDWVCLGALDLSLTTK